LLERSPPAPPVDGYGEAGHRLSGFSPAVSLLQFQLTREGA